jgi:hypothetical protein
MNLKALLVVVLLAFGFTSKAQNGNYFLSHYTPSDERIDYLTFDMAQGDKGVLYFANKSGVLEFDGRNWSLISTPGPIYTVTTQGDDVFVGGFSGFGKLIWGPDGEQAYQSLSQDQPDATQILSSLRVGDTVYFLNEQAIYIYSATAAKTDTVIKVSSGQSAFTGLYDVGGTICIGTEKDGLLKMDKGKLVKTSFGLPEKLKLLFCSTLKTSKSVLLGTDSNRFFVYDRAALKEIQLKDKSFLEHNVTVGGTWVSENLIAIGTLRGGVIFIDPQTGDTKEIINYYTGLPDNEMYSILCDRNQGVWIAHDYGFTRIAPFLPFRSYSHYPGLEGSLLCAHSFKGQLYAGTTLGLYTLVKEELYEDEPVLTPLQEQALTAPEESLKSKKGPVSSLKKEKRPQKKPTNPKAKTKSRVVQPPKPTTRRVLKSVQYAFKKVGGTDGKVSLLIEANGKFLAAGIIGVVEVEGVTSKSITQAPVRSFFLSPSLNQLLVGTVNAEIKSFSFDQKEGWRQTHLLDSLQEYVTYMFEDKLQNIWLCARTRVFKVETVDNEITDVINVPFSNPSMDEPLGVSLGSEVYVAASGYFNKYDIRENKFVRFKNNQLPGAKKYFASAGSFWFYDGHQWRTFDDNMKRTLRLEWLGLFQNIRYIAPTGNGEGLWVITGGNDLYNFTSNKVLAEQSDYPLFLREVRSQQSKIAPARSLRISQLESTVSFEFIQPDYLGMKAVEYRYLVQGLNKDTSAWSTSNNIVNFSYLPTGEYKVIVQTRDLMGKKSKVEQIELQVEPPFWKQSWFYAAEFTFFSMLVFLSLRLSTANNKYRFLSRLLSLLTVIMLIQFIQTVVASQISFKSTPVIDFFIQVFIALLVLPIEGYLRKFMIRSAEGAALPSRLWDQRSKD